MEAGDAGGVVPGQCSRSVPTSTCARRVPACWGCEARGRSPRGPVPSGEQPGEEKTGRANAS